MNKIHEFNELKLENTQARARIKDLIKSLEKSKQKIILRDIELLIANEISQEELCNE